MKNLARIRRLTSPSILVALRTPLGIATALGIACFLVLAIFAPPLLSNDANAFNVSHAFAPPNSAHLLGTDALGRDILARVLVATRLSLILAFLATALGVITGLALGMVITVAGRRLGRLLAGTVNALVAFPGLLLAMFLAVVFGIGTTGAVLAIGLSLSPNFARFTQTLAASVAGEDYISAARTVGVRRTRLLLRHILPNIGEPLAVNTALSAARVLLAFAGLSFLGLGVQPPNYDWGLLLNEGLNRIYINPAAALAPGIAVTLAGITLALAGELIASMVGLRSTTSKLPGQKSRSAYRRAERRRQGGLPESANGDPMLRVRELFVLFPTHAGVIKPVEGVSFDVLPGETLGIVGESGSGKSLTALAVGGLVAPPGVVQAAELTFAGRDISAPGSAARRDPGLRNFLATRMAMVFQNPMNSFNPALRIGRQLAEVAETHHGASRTEASRMSVERLRDALIPEPEWRIRQYPHEFSGGMLQRSMIAMCLMGTPRLLIADEPTTALDVTSQQQVLRLLRQARDETEAALLLISHDIAVISTMCERVLVMYAGLIVEDLATAQLQSGAAHPYTRALLAAALTMDIDRARPLRTIPGRPPDPAQRPAGCPFTARCSFADTRCEVERPPLRRHHGQHYVACWHPQSGPVELDAGQPANRANRES